MIFCAITKFRSKGGRWKCRVWIWQTKLENMKMQDVQPVPYEGLTTKCVRVVEIFTRLAKYYNITVHICSL